MEDHTRQDRAIPKRQRFGGRGVSGLIPWLGGVFWLLLWAWLLIPRQRIEVPNEWDLISRSASSMRLQGFRVRQETRYTDGGSTYMDLQAERGWNLEDSDDSNVLVNVEVRLVTQKQTKSATGTEGFGGLSARADVAWVLIEAATGFWSVKTRNIDLMGNVQIYGYTMDGELTEWISAERLFYDSREKRVRSISPATYEGRTFQIGKAYRCFVETDDSLSEINITELDLLDSDFRTPFRFPEMLPPYSPPEALRFLRNAPQTRS